MEVTYLENLVSPVMAAARLASVLPLSVKHVPLVSSVTRAAVFLLAPLAQ